MIRLVPMNAEQKSEFIDILLEETLAEKERKMREEEEAARQATQDAVDAANEELEANPEQ